MTEHQVLVEAKQRYLYDALFHARVEATINVLNLELGAGTAEWLDPADRSLAAHAASVALVMATLDPTTGEPLA